MSERERPSHLPELPPLWTRLPDYVPHALAGPAPVPELGVVPSPETTVPPEPSASTGDTPEEPGRERVTLTGRLGQDPRIRTTRKGTLVAQFPLGVKDEADFNKTTWHTVVAFRQRAEQVRDTLKKGDAVEVIGYRHERQVPHRDGSTRTVQEVYATVIKRR